MTSSSETKHYDVIIVGGGMTGATLALALYKMKSSSLSIALVESVELNSYQHPGYDSRSIALSYGTQELLDSIELWKDIDPFVTHIRSVHVSDSGHFGLAELQASEYYLDNFGSVVELADVGRIYHQKLVSLPEVTLYCPASVIDVHRKPNQLMLTLSTGEILSGSLVVAADGSNSTLCQMMNIEQDVYDFEQTAMIANITTECLHNGRAFERFTKDGPIALLPMSENRERQDHLSKSRSSLVFCASKKEVDKLMTYNDVDFLAHLQRQFGWRLGKIEKIGTRMSYPLLSYNHEQSISHRFITIGNASQTLHPIAGQGFNLGIRDVFTLVECLIDALDQDIDLGDYSVLSRYRQRRVDDKKQTINMTSGLISIFSNELYPMVVGRNVGLYTANVFGFLLQPLMLRAMGKVKR